MDIPTTVSETDVQTIFIQTGAGQGWKEEEKTSICLKLYVEFKYYFVTVCIAYLS